MSGLKFLFAVLFCFQSDEIDDTETALALLSYQIEEASVALSKAPYLWSEYLSYISIAYIDYLQADGDNFRFISNNISAIAIHLADGIGQECIEILSNAQRSFAPYTFSSEELVFTNLFSLAQIDVSIANDQYFNLYNNEFITNCLLNDRNCEGTSRAIIAEVERLLPTVNRIPFDLLTEMYGLYYKLDIAMENAHTELMQTFNKAVQNAVVCVASKISGLKQEPVPIVPSKSVFDLFDDLIAVTESANATSVNNLRSSKNQVRLENSMGYFNYMSRVNTAILRTNSTINLLIGVAQEYNVTLNCAVVDLSSRSYSSFERLVQEFVVIEDGIMIREYTKGTKEISDVGRGIHSIALEIEDCTANASCDYLAEKIASKQSKIPWQMQRVTNSTIAALQQTVTALRESGARVVRDTVEQLDVGLIDLKSCIQSSF